MSVGEPRPNPETVEALLDAAWHIVAVEVARTDALDRKAATLATFASLLATLLATLGGGVVAATERRWQALIFLPALVVLLVAVTLAVRALVPKEYLTIGMPALESFKTWAAMSSTPVDVQGVIMRGVVEAVARERRANERKARAVAAALRLMLAALMLIVGDVATLALEEAIQ